MLSVNGGNVVRMGVNNPQDYTLILGRLYAPYSKPFSAADSGRMDLENHTFPYYWAIHQICAPRSNIYIQ